MAKENKFDTVVVGGGAAGMMAAITASGNGGSVVILEKNKTLGRKLLMTGDGRCNVTHFGLTNREFAGLFGKEGDFLLSPLSRFGPAETMAFFENLGAELKTEPDGRVFPKSNKAQDILAALLKKLKQNKVFIFTEAEVKEIKIENDSIAEIVLADGEKIIGKKYIISVGGKSYPITGSTGDGFVWAEKLGHTIIKPRPSLVPVQVKENWIKTLSGLSFEKVKVSLSVLGKIAKKETGDILFAHFGLTGPLILNLSKDIGALMAQGKVKILVDLQPDKDQEQLEGYLQKSIEKNKKKEIKNILADFLPAKIAPYLIYFAGLKEKVKGFELKKEEREKLAKVIKKLEFNVVSLVGFDRAMVTAGGVALKEIDSKTMKSKKIGNLYFAGEIINLDGPCGGYNLQLCWTTGRIAGSAD
ncbi:MAG: NAD(P)/FAD-dependent oxidoreductase [Candidatus Pacebacteria bacterium]|nr:NAD(P)/FAD-dependent oxidoreductase [Candidatus Paceibacterota bacterium]